MNNEQQFDPWTVERPITKGRTYLVSKENDPARYVLKTPGNREAQNIRNEIEALRRVTNHPNIVNMVDYDSEAETPWQVTEYCKGTNKKEAG